jgi:hypothetical protein
VRILIGCEFSGAVRDAFIAAGHDAVSCDLMPTEPPGPHLQCDIRLILDRDWDLLVAFPPCTHLAASGARWWPLKQREQAEAIRFVRDLMNAPIPRIAIENPVGRLSSAIRSPDQIIQPWQFGHAEIKTTCLWLKHLPPLEPTSIVLTAREQRCWKMPPSVDRARERSRTYSGIAGAMAAQWPGTGNRQLQLFPQSFEALQ